MLKIYYANSFKKEIKKQEKRGKNLKKMTEIITKLVTGQKLEDRHKLHKLHGDYKDHWECHREPDWLLIFRKTPDSITFERTGSHSDLFSK
ncbi:MAG TPA: type II toxin-antitoxin system YafQ family toxin [Chlamydiales bacterium]|nr:type II toxin-antitoxin system YafQ family toxin [Chlamydiales bacterium]